LALRLPDRLTHYIEVGGARASAASILIARVNGKGLELSQGAIAGLVAYCSSSRTNLRVDCWGYRPGLL